MPVDPPKVNTLIFERMVDFGEISLEEFSISRVEQDRLILVFLTK